jgi:precorrin-6B methylase 2
MKKLIYKSSNQCNPLLVWRDENFMVLTIGDEGIQTKINLDSPHSLQLPHLHPMAASCGLLTNIKNILLFGLGGGALIHWLKNKHPKCEITAVEKNPEVIVLAKQYFKLNQYKQNIQYITDCAFTHALKDMKKYDVIFIDLNGTTTNRLIELASSTLGLLGDTAICSLNFQCDTKEQASNALISMNRLFNYQCISIPLKNTMNLVITGSTQSDFSQKINTLHKTKRLQFDKRLITQYGIIAQEFLP